jgi:hypothetical protein
MSEGRKKLRRRTLEKALRRRMAEAGIDPASVDFSAFDLDSYERLLDLLHDVARDPTHEYRHIAQQVLRHMDRYADYYGWPADATETPAEDGGDGDVGAGELRAAIQLLEDRLARVEDRLGAAASPASGEDLRGEIERLAGLVAELRAEYERAVKANADFVASLWAARADRPTATPTATGGGRGDGGPASRPRVRQPRGAGGLVRLALGSVIAVTFNAIAMPMLAYSNNWTDAQTFLASMLTTMAVIGLMLLEGLWVNTVFGGSKPSAKGFVAGYVYSQGVNPYEQR